MISSATFQSTCLENGEVTTPKKKEDKIKGHLKMSQRQAAVLSVTSQWWAQEDWGFHSAMTRLRWAQHLLFSTQPEKSSFKGLLMDIEMHHVFGQCENQRNPEN